MTKNVLLTIIASTVLAFMIGIIAWATVQKIMNQPPTHDRVWTCKRVLTSRLRSPSTVEYVRVDELYETTQKRVLIEYDAANAFGTPVRGNIECIFGSPDDPSLLTGLVINGEKETSKEVARINVQILLDEIERGRSQ